MHTLHIMTFEGAEQKVRYDANDAKRLFERYTDDTLAGVFHVSWYGPNGHVNSWSDLQSTQAHCREAHVVSELGVCHRGPPALMLRLGAACDALQWAANPIREAPPTPEPPDPTNLGRGLYSEWVCPYARQFLRHPGKERGTPMRLFHQLLPHEREVAVEQVADQFIAALGRGSVSFIGGSEQAIFDQGRRDGGLPDREAFTVLNRVWVTARAIAEDEVYP